MTYPSRTCVLGVHGVLLDRKTFKFIYIQKRTPSKIEDTPRNTLAPRVPQPYLLPAGQVDEKAVSSRGAGISQGFFGARGEYE